MAGPFPRAWLAACPFAVAGEYWKLGMSERTGAAGARWASFRSVVPGVAWPAIPADRGAHLLSLLFQFEQSQWWGGEELRACQFEQLGLMLRHARETVPFYAERLPSCGLDTDRLSPEDFARLPVLRRSELQQSAGRMESWQVPPSHGQVREGYTSGSTGRPLRFLGTGVTGLFFHALMLRDHCWQKRDLSARLAVIRSKIASAGHPNWGPGTADVFQTGPADILDIGNDIERQLDWIAEKRPAYLLTHPSNLRDLAMESLRRQFRPAGLRQARTFGEALHDGLRELVRDAWGVEIADTYSSEECGYIALQCPAGNSYHIQAESLLVEVLDATGRPCGPGETGRVVVTTLHNFAMPLVRYEIGDHAEVGKPCPCGRGLPVLARIHGRSRNMLQLPDGRRHWPSFPARMWLQIAPIEQFRLVQTEMDRVEVLYVMRRDLNAEEAQRLAAALHIQLGYPFVITFRRLDRIERGANRKFEDFVSELPLA